jgi:Flp pilus assembly protein TadD
LLLRGLALMNFGILLPLAACGMWFERERWRQLAVLYALMLALVGSIVMFFVFARYRFPLVAPLALFAAVPIARLVSKPWPSRADWLPGLALAGIAGVAAWWPIDVGADQTYLNVGRQLTTDGRHDAAVPILKESVERNPSDPLDVFTLAVAFDRSGDKPSAIQSYRRAVELNPANGRYQGALALALMEIGLPDQALQHFALSVVASPSDGALRTNYGVALLQSSDAEGAVAQLQEAVRIDPANARSLANLGLAMALAGRLTEATNHLERAVTLDPSLSEAKSALTAIYVKQGRRAPPQ